MKKIVVTINPSGEVLIDVINYQSAKCLERTKSIEQAFGEVLERVLKPEFYLPPKEQIQIVEEEKEAM